MNNIEKTFKKKEKREASKIRKWWQKHGVNIIRILLLWPLILPFECYRRYKDSVYKKMSYSDDITKKYLDKCLPALVAHCEESSDVFLFHNCDDYSGIRFFWAFNSSWFRKKFKKQSLYFTKFSRETQDYITSNYQVEGYSKRVLDNWIDWKDACKRFDWGEPYNIDYVKGVVFYKE